MKKKVRHALDAVEADLERSERQGGNEAELRYLRSAVRGLVERGADRGAVMSAHPQRDKSDAMRLYDPAELAADGYPPQWHETIKHAVREMAGDRCVRCGHPYSKGAGEWSPCDENCTHRGPYRYRHGPVDEWFHTDEDEPWIGEAGLGSDVDVEVHARWRILTVHHLDGDKANCRWWNLAALCQRCHLQVQGKVQMARVWPWEHSEWFRPYVAAYYAWAYLGEDLTRAEAEARMDDLLALERVA